MRKQSLEIEIEEERYSKREVWEWTVWAGRTRGEGFHKEKRRQKVEIKNRVRVRPGELEELSNESRGGKNEWDRQRSNDGMETDAGRTTEDCTSITDIQHAAGKPSVSKAWGKAGLALIVWRHYLTLGLFREHGGEDIFKQYYTLPEYCHILVCMAPQECRSSRLPASTCPRDWLSLQASVPLSPSPHSHSLLLQAFSSFLFFFWKWWH